MSKSQALSMRSMIPPPGIRPAHSTRWGTPSTRIHSQWTKPVPNPTVRSRVSVAEYSSSSTAGSGAPGTTWPSSTGRSPGNRDLAVTLRKNAPPSRTSSSTLYSGPSRKVSASIRAGTALCAAMASCSASTHSRHASSTCSGARTIRVPMEPWRLAGLRTTAVPVSAISRRTSSGCSTGRESGPRTPLPATACRSSHLSRSRSAACGPAPGRPYSSARRAANGTAYSMPGMTAAGGRPRYSRWNREAASGSSYSISTSSQAASAPARTSARFFSRAAPGVSRKTVVPWPWWRAATLFQPAV
ncbi:hypothetical protein BG846_01384 [Streptomyces fradiae ATCC 10745 = DSM 40063]|uniref:Uncharacterized protein n=1 Tax=Streptomyces fradiae ATCC 10745 = DSM 40063 TaxID=1319510 RepID=A0A1Y2NZK8_STRFR|nr:hypothetical protein BG846_01384 [Streptomyces fradiae ATCC 10745 = DSM 40063]